MAIVEAEGREFPFDGPEQVTPGVLEVFPYEYPGREAEVEIVTDEWNCVCPFSGLPDFGTLTVRYVPTDVCVELKSLKYYLTSYRTVGIYQDTPRTGSSRTWWRCAGRAGWRSCSTTGCAAACTPR